MAGLPYPPRMILNNPPPASGTVRTTDTSTIEIDNVHAMDVSDERDNATERVTVSSGDRFDTYLLVAITVDSTVTTGSDDQTVVGNGF